MIYDASFLFMQKKILDNENTKAILKTSVRMARDRIRTNLNYEDIAFFS